MAGSPVAADLSSRALRTWLAGLPADMQAMVAREARVHVTRRDRHRLPALLLERYQENPFVRAVLEHWLRKSHENLLMEVQSFTGPPEPDGVEFLRRLREENGLDVSTLAWLVGTSDHAGLAQAGPVAFPGEWPEAEAAVAAAPPPPSREAELTKQWQKLLREKEEEVRRLRAALARQEREAAHLEHRLAQAQKKLAEEAARRQELLGELERARQAAREAEQRYQARLQEELDAFQKDRQQLQAETAAAWRLVREREESLLEATRRLRRARVEAERWRVQFLTLEAYLDVTSPRRGALPPEAFVAYGELLDQAEGELLQRFRPESARELALRLAELHVARQVHRSLSQAAVPEAPPEPLPAPPAEAAGPLIREADGGRERFYVRLPDRYQPVDVAAVSAIGALPGDVVAVEPRCERQPGSAHFYLYFHLREAQPRMEEIATLLAGGPPWVADTSRGPLPVLGAGDRPLEPGEPVVVAYPEQGPLSYCVLVRVLPYAGELARPLPHRRPDASREGSGGEAPSRRRRPLLEGRTIYILGGEGFEANYRHVVEGYGGQFLWTSGFGELRHITHRVRQADAVVLVTRGVSHKAYDHLQNALTLHGRPLFYCNALGQSHLERVLENEVIPALVPHAVQG